MIPIEGRLRWRKTAPFHIQIELQKSSMQFKVPSKVEIRGRVVRVFRTNGQLACGDAVEFALWVCDPGDEPTGSAYIYQRDFNRAAHMEVYLHGSPPKCELAAYEFATINGPSDEPTMMVAQLEDRPRPEERQVFERASLETSNSKRWWQFWKRSMGRNEQPDWLTKLHEPFFRTRKDVETYMTRELPLAVPEGWAIRRNSSGSLAWVINKEKLRPEEWSMQDYSVQVSKGLDFVIFTYENTDVGPFSIHHALLQALVIEAAMLRMCSLSECVKFLFVHCKPNEWGYT